jgi:hypothetical protein
MSRLKKIANKPTFKEYLDDNLDLIYEIARDESKDAEDDYDELSEILYSKYYKPKYGVDPTSDFN